MAGRLISFEGISGAGKTTLIDKFQDYLLNRNISVGRKEDLLFYQGTDIGYDIRCLLEKYRKGDPFFRIGLPEVETLLISAKRAYEYQTTLNPKLSMGQYILADRDIDTVCAYQLTSIKNNGNDRFNSIELIKLIRDISFMTTNPPVLTFYLEVSLPKALERIKARDNNDMKDSEIDFLKRAKKYYKDVLNSKITGRELIKIDTNRLDVDQVFNKACRLYEKWEKR